MYVAISESFFDDAFISVIENEIKDTELKKAVTKNPTLDVRRSEVMFLESRELKQILFDVVRYVNSKSFGFDITNIGDVQYTVYDSKYEGHYDWHSDEDIAYGSPRFSCRKLSITIQLSEPEDYEGGDFEMEGVELPSSIKQKGTVLVFPSPQRHRVMPVTKGIRKSLVAWFEGPDWR